MASKNYTSGLMEYRNDWFRNARYRFVLYENSALRMNLPNGEEFVCLPLPLLIFLSNHLSHILWIDSF